MNSIDSEDNISHDHVISKNKTHFESYQKVLQAIKYIVVAFLKIVTLREGVPVSLCLEVKYTE